MSAPWSLGGVRRGTGPAAQLLLPLSYAPVGWGSKTLKLWMLFVLPDVAVKNLKGLVDRFRQGNSSLPRGLHGEYEHLVLHHGENNAKPLAKTYRPD